MTDKTTVINILQGALKLIRAKSRWIKSGYAADKNLKPVYRDSIGGCYVGAECFCAVGAIHQAGCDDGSAAVNAAYDALKRVINKHFGDVETWNDARQRTHAQVVAAFKKAIVKARAQAA